MPTVPHRSIAHGYRVFLSDNYVHDGVSSFQALLLIRERILVKKTLPPIPAVITTSKRFVYALFSPGEGNRVIYREPFVGDSLPASALMLLFLIPEPTLALPAVDHACGTTELLFRLLRSGLFGMICFQNRARRLLSGQFDVHEGCYL